MTRIVGQRSGASTKFFSIVLALFALGSVMSYATSMWGGLIPIARIASDEYLLAQMLALLIFFFIGAVIRTQKSIEWAVKGLVIGGSISAFFAVLEFATGVDFAEKLTLPGLKAASPDLVDDLVREGVRRAQGSAGHPLELGAVMTTLIPLAIGITFVAFESGRKWRLWACTVALLSAGAIVSVSRSSIIALGVALLIMAWRWPVKRVLIATGTAVALTAIAFISNAKLLNAFAGIFGSSANDPSIASRARGQQYVAEHYGNHPWFGQGIGTYPILNQPYLDNEYLGRLMETGIFGVATLILLLVTALGYALVAARNHDIAEMESTSVARGGGEIARAIAASLTAIIIINTILDTSGFAQITGIIWILIGLSAASWSVSKQSLRSARDKGTEAPSH
ncbi:O-antigen ligase family protein [Antrihabitans cavernicola]|nr:O-antigen ligase family protein [Spelaeibacter cavernicola]